MILESKLFKIPIRNAAAPVNYRIIRYHCHIYWSSFIQLDDRDIQRFNEDLSDFPDPDLHWSSFIQLDDRDIQRFNEDLSDFPTLAQFFSYWRKSPPPGIT